MNNWIPIDEFLNLDYRGTCWVTDGHIVMLAHYAGGDLFRDIETEEYPCWLSNITKVIPIPEPKP